MSEVYLLFCAGLSIFYAALLLYHLLGWERMPYFKKNTDTGTGEDTSHYYSIIIPVRNEAQNIRDCLQDILQQNFDPGSFEIIVVDDHSSDDTAARVEQMKAGARVPLTLIRLQEENSQQKAYKKRAITLALERARGDIIITTDGDCRRGPDWLSTIDACFRQEKAVLISGPVAFAPANLFERMQALEFWGLIGIGAAAIAMKRPNMCNAANLAYRKEAFYKAGGYAGNDHLSSGDDEFLMHKLARLYPGKLRFLKNRDALVSTHPEASLKGFIRQRKRWVSKSTHYYNKLITLLMAMIYFYELSLLLNFVLWIAFGWPAKIFLWQIGAKILLETVFLWRVLRSFAVKKLLRYLLLAQPFHILYVLYIGLAGNMGKYEWKGRTVK